MSKTQVAAGVDLGEKALDVVLLREDRSVLRVIRLANPFDLQRLLGEHTPDIVAIDSPPRPAKSGKSREADRRLLTLGIHAYWTPSDPARLPGWMQRGAQVFAAAESAGYPLYLNGQIRHRAIEVFPHACAVALKGVLPPKGWKKQPGKRGWRSDILRSCGVAVADYWSTDEVDAALAALTGMLALEGVYAAVGDPEEGVIVMPLRSLPDRFEREGALQYSPRW